MDEAFKIVVDLIFVFLPIEIFFWPFLQLRGTIFKGTCTQWEHVPSGYMYPVGTCTLVNKVLSQCSHWVHVPTENMFPLGTCTHWVHVPSYLARKSVDCMQKFIKIIEK